MTHGLTFLPQCDLIVVLDEGRIREMGTYSELVNNKGAFAEFLQTYATTEEGEGIVYWGGGRRYSVLGRREKVLCIGEEGEGIVYWGGGRRYSVLGRREKV